MMGNTTGADILKAVFECLSRLELDLARLSALTADGASSMVGGNKGFSSLMVKHCQDRGFKEPIKSAALHCAPGGRPVCEVGQDEKRHVSGSEGCQLRSCSGLQSQAVSRPADGSRCSMVTYYTIARYGGSVVDVCWSGCITCEKCVLSYAARARTFLNSTILVGCVIWPS